MAEIRIDDVDQVYIDGVLAGQVMDVVRNHPQHASDVQRALKAWSRDLQQAHQDEVRTVRQNLQGKLDEAKAHIDALGGTELAKQLRRQQRRQQLQEQEARVKAELEALGTEETGG